MGTQFLCKINDVDLPQIRELICNAHLTNIIH